MYTSIHLILGVSVFCILQLIACTMFQADTRTLKMSAWKQLASEKGMKLVIYN